MLKVSLREFIETVIENKMISAEDVRTLQRDILENGLSSRMEAEALLALDRSLPAHESWAEALTTLIVDYAVWGSRPTGYVTREESAWLAAVLDLGGPTPTAMRIAYAIVDEAQQVDESLLHFILRGRQQARERLAA